MIIDSHLHIWCEATDPRADPLNGLPSDGRHWPRVASLADVDADMRGAGVTGSVLVQIVNTLRHTDDLLAEAASAPRPTKVVGWLPLANPQATAQALARYTDRPALAGVRHRIRAQEDPELLLRPEAARSLDMVSDAGLSLDVLPWPQSALDLVPKLARRHPRLRIVIDVLGWPQIDQGRMQPWTDQLAAAAAEPGVFIKVGGLYRVSGRIGPDAWQPYVATAVQVFGPERIMIGSSWPTDSVFGPGYTESIRSVLAAFNDLTEAERAKVRYGTASKVYGLR